MFLFFPLVSLFYGRVCVFCRGLAGFCWCFDVFFAGALLRTNVAENCSVLRQKRYEHQSNLDKQFQVTTKRVTNWAEPMVLVGRNGAFCHDPEETFAQQKHATSYIYQPHFWHGPRVEFMIMRHMPNGTLTGFGVGASFCAHMQLCWHVPHISKRWRNIH